VDLSSTQGALSTVSVFFLFYILLIWGGVRTQHPLPTGLSVVEAQVSVVVCGTKLTCNGGRSPDEKLDHTERPHQCVYGRPIQHDARVCASRGSFCDSRCSFQFTFSPVF